MAHLGNGAVRRICVHRLRGTLEMLAVALEQCFDPVAARIEQGFGPVQPVRRARSALVVINGICRRLPSLEGLGKLDLKILIVEEILPVVNRKEIPLGNFTSA
jgi:hypothetical protein